MEIKEGWKKLELRKRSKRIRKHARKIETVTTRHAHKFIVSRWDKIQEVRVNIVMWLLGVGALISIVGVQMIWFQQSYVTTAPVAGGTYAEGVLGPVQSLDPLFAKSPAELSVSQLLFSSLYKQDSSGHLKGDLAVSMKDEYSKVYTIKIRKDARWHDGKPVTASDVVYTAGLMKDSAVHAAMESSWQKVGIEQVDDYTVRFVLPAAYSAFPQALTFSVLPKHILKDIKPSEIQESTFSTNPVGSGPFMLRLLQNIGTSGTRKIVHLDASPLYYDGRPKLDHLQLHVYPSNDDLALALKTNEINGASNISSTMAKNLKGSRYKVVIKPINSGVYAIFNTQQKILNNVHVRKALQLATNTKEIRDKIYGNPRELSLPFMTSLVEGSEGLKAPTQNLVEASSLLESDGWKLNGTTRKKGNDELVLKVVTRKNADFEDSVNTLAKQWRKIGVRVEVRVVDTSDPTQNYSTEIISQHNYDVLVDELAIGGDPNVYSYWHTKGSPNLASYSNELSDDDLSSARSTSDSKLRSIKYVSFAKRWLEDAPAIALYQSNFIYAHTPKTHILSPDETIISADQHYANVLYWTANSDTVYKTP